MDYIRIVNWEDFQHYKERNPPWIKLHTQLLDNDMFECLQNDSKLLLLCLWLFNARKGNGQVKADEKYLARKLPVTGKVRLQPLIDAGFIEVYQDDSIVQASDDSKVLASDRGETEGETEQSKEKFLDFVFLLPEEHSKLLEQFGKAGLKERLAALNDYIGSRGVKYKSHYHTILAWERKNGRTSSTNGKGSRRDGSFEFPPDADSIEVSS